MCCEISVTCHHEVWGVFRPRNCYELRIVKRNETKQSRKNGGFSAAITKRLTSTFQITQYNASETNQVAIFDDTMEKLEILLL